jgi:hypothetical protein
LGPISLGEHGESLQPVHPDIVFQDGGFQDGGFAGFRYWLAFTPYPWGLDRVENPSMRVSNDGVSWQPVPGAPDPLVPSPEDSDSHHADTDLVLHDGRLYLVYMTRNKRTRQTTYSLIESADGIEWTPPLEIYRGTTGLSPSVVVHDNCWWMWSVEIISADPVRTRLVLLKGQNPKDLSPSAVCHLNIPGWVVWHLDVQWTGRLFETVVTAYPIGSDDSRTALFHAHSHDGSQFRQTVTDPILQPTSFGWDNRQIYRSTFLKAADSDYSVWYSAASWAMFYGIGLASGPLQNLRRVPCRPMASHPAGVRKVISDLTAASKYHSNRHLPTGVATTLRNVRNFIFGIRKSTRP